MAVPKKDLDRLRPFKRINNESAIPAAPPDGRGVTCGCHTPREFPNLEADFRAFLRQRRDALGRIFEIVEAAKAVARTAAEASAIVGTLAKAAAVLLPSLAGGPIAAVIGALVTIVQAVNVAVSFVNGLLSAIDAAINEFLVRIGAALARRALRRIPQWVPVEDAANRQRITVAQIREVEGLVGRSYCDAASTPFFQWNHWLGWTIQVRPEPAYRNLLVPGLAFATDSLKGGERPLADAGAVEVRWDMGALRVGGGAPGVYGRDLNDDATEAELTDREAPFFQSDKATLEAENNWLWPTAGMYVWASGRWVYDCGRPDSLTERNPRMVAMIQPARAMATATWEAFAFKENVAGTGSRLRNRVPAIRFMFIASRHGGHLTQPLLAEKDYEFILDLPPMPVPVTPFPIGHTHAHKRDDGGPPDFPHNTIVLRPKLLRDLARPSAPFPATVKLVTPVIEMLPDADDPGIVRQVKVTVKAGDLDGTGDGHAGFLLSLGWFDPNATQAETVKNCSVEFTGVRGRLQQERDTPVQTLRELFKPELDEVKKKIVITIENDIKLPIVPGLSPISVKEMIDSDIPGVSAIGKMFRNLAVEIIDTVFDKLLELLAGAAGAASTEEWMMHFGVNGRWRSRYLDLDKNRQQAFSSPAAVEIALGPQDLLFHSTGGVEWSPVGNIMFAARNKRLLRRNGEAVVWSQIATATGDELRDLMFEYALQILLGAEGQPLALGVENDPLGLRQPKGLDAADGRNPMAMKDTEPGDPPFDRSTARFARSAGRQVVLPVENAAVDDYVPSGTVHVAKQLPK